MDQAEQFLSQSNGSKYHLLLLDLGIPRKRVGEATPPENGEELLEKVRRTGTAKEVIVISVWKQVQHVARAFRGGAIDFIAKPYTAKVLQARVIEGWKRLLAKESTRILGEERIRNLVPYAEKGLAHRFSTCFSSLVRTVAHSSEDIERYMSERYGLDRRKDAEDYFFKCMNEQEETVMKTKQEWAALKAPLQSKEETHEIAAVETLLRQIHQVLLPCFIVKNAEIEFSAENAGEILTFEDDARAVLTEILVGVLNQLPDYGEPKQTINVKVKNANGQVSVRFADRLDRITLLDSKNINAGSNITPDRRFGREWGLSVVQHIAMRGGGRLEVEPQKTRGNFVTYFIPSAN
jgi:CheY-like chemotaxis protein